MLKSSDPQRTGYYDKGFLHGLLKVCYICSHTCLEKELSSIVILTYYVFKSGDKGIIKQKKTER